MGRVFPSSGDSRGAILHGSSDEEVPWDKGVSDDHFFDPGNHVYAVAFKTLWPELATNWSLGEEALGDVFESIMGLQWMLDASLVTIDEDTKRPLKALAAFLEQQAYLVHRVFATTAWEHYYAAVPTFIAAVWERAYSPPPPPSSSTDSYSRPTLLGRPPLPLLSSTSCPAMELERALKSNGRSLRLVLALLDKPSIQASVKAAVAVVASAEKASAKTAAPGQLAHQGRRSQDPGAAAGCGDKPGDSCGSSRSAPSRAGPSCGDKPGPSCGSSRRAPSRAGPSCGDKPGPSCGSSCGAPSRAAHGGGRRGQRS